MATVFSKYHLLTQLACQMDRRRGSHGMSAKGKMPKGLQLEVGAQRATRLLVICIVTLPVTNFYCLVGVAPGSPNHTNHASASGLFSSSGRNVTLSQGSTCQH